MKARMTHVVRCNVTIGDDAICSTNTCNKIIYGNAQTNVNPIAEVQIIACNCCIENLYLLSLCCLPCSGRSTVCTQELTYFPCIPHGRSSIVHYISRCQSVGSIDNNMWWCNKFNDGDDHSPVSTEPWQWWSVIKLVMLSLSIVNVIMKVWNSKLLKELIALIGNQNLSVFQEEKPSKLMIYVTSKDKMLISLKTLLASMISTLNY